MSYLHGQFCELLSRDLMIHIVEDRDETICICIPVCCCAMWHTTRAMFRLHNYVGRIVCRGVGSGKHWAKEATQLLATALPYMDL